LPDSECSAWRELYFNLDGVAWTTCKDAVADPCNSDLCPGVKCEIIDPSEQKVHITEIVLPGIGAKGTLVNSIVALSYLRKMDLSKNAVTAVPTDICQLPASALSSKNGSLANNPFDCTHGPLPPCISPTGALCTTGPCIGSSSYMDTVDCSAWTDFATAMGPNPSTDPCAHHADATVTCTPPSSSSPQFITGITKNWNDPFAALDSKISLPKSLAKMKHLTMLKFNGGLQGGLPDLPFGQYSAGCVLNVRNAFDCDTFPASASQCIPAPGGTPPACSKGGCVGESLMLDKADCDAWKKVVQPSPYFTQAPTPICSGGHYKYNPCSCNKQETDPSNNALGCNNGRIVSVDLASMGLTFDMDTEDALSHLSGLQWLNVSKNSLTGPMPQWLTVLADSLLELRMSDNPFTGSIDTVKNLKKLKTLFLSNCCEPPYFNGTIDAVKGLVNLETLLLNGVPMANGAGLDIHFTGPIDAVKGLEKLKNLQLASNYFSGTLGPVAGLTQLTRLHAHDNLFTGTVNMLKGLTSLDILWLSRNRLTGGIDALKQLTNLQGQPAKYGFWPGLALANNQFTGPIDAIYNMRQLRGLTLSNNSFTGIIGDGFRAQTMPTLTYIDLSVNNFTAVPSNLVDWSRFTDHCDLHHEAFTCSAAMAIPAQAKAHCGATCCSGSSADLMAGDCDAWQNVVLKSQYFTKANPPACNESQHIVDPCSCAGVIGCKGGRITSIYLSERNLSFNASTDSSLSHLTGLQMLDLDRNQLGGPLPPWLQKLAGSLNVLELWSNRFTGAIDVLGSLTGLTYLDLPDNGLFGPMDALAQLTNLQTLSLCCNTGPFSGVGALSKLTKLKNLNIWGGKIDGTMDALKDLVQLENLELGDNALNGTIEAAKGLKKLVYLNLANNRLSGSIDDIKELMSLTTLRLDNNQFRGPVPQELAQLECLTDVTLHANSFTGILPAFNFSQYTQCCVMDGSIFDCPLPAGSQNCAGGPCVGGAYEQFGSSCVRNGSDLSCPEPMCT
jgi:Leucine-rich repeat (LRR) protein